MSSRLVDGDPATEQQLTTSNDNDDDDSTFAYDEGTTVNNEMDKSEATASNRSEDDRNSAVDAVLVEATLVCGDHEDNEEQEAAPPVVIPELELVEAESFDGSEFFTPQAMIKSRKGRKLIVGALLLILAVICVAVSIVVALWRLDKLTAPIITEAPTVSAPTTGARTITEAPTVAPISFSYNLLPDYTQEAILQNNTPQAKAYEWLLADLAYQQNDTGNAERYQSFNPVGRFALATLFYATNGTNWRKGKDWLDHGIEACEWYNSFSGSVCVDPGQQSGRRGLGEGEAQQPILFRGAQRENRYTQASGMTRRLQRPPPPRPGTDTGSGSAHGPAHGPVPRLLMTRLSHYENNLQGQLPAELTLLRSLDVVDFHGNQLNGTIPSEFGTWRYVTLFQFYENNLTGSLPTELGNLESVEQISLAKNSLNGTIPTGTSKNSDSLDRKRMFFHTDTTHSFFPFLDV